MAFTTLQDSPADQRATPAAARERVGHRVPVAIAGAGYIAGYHLEVLRQLGSTEVVGACDPNAARLDALCRQWGIPVAAPSLADLLRRCRPEVVHVLVPPPYHFDVAREALGAGMHTLVEKPMALRAAECAALIDLARARGVRLGVNHNAVHHPAFRRLLADLAGHKLGRVEHVVSVHNLPLAQLQSGEHDHWMFREPANILFEQAVHPLSQICELLGGVRDAAVTCTGERVLNTGAVFRSAWQMSLTCERGTAQLFIAFGPSFPESVVHVLGQDGTARLDLLNNTYALDRATKYIEPVDRCLRSVRAGCRVALGGAAGFGRYALSTLRLRKRTDPYYVSMLESIAAFYRAPTPGAGPRSSARGGLDVVAGVELAAARAAVPARPAAPRPQPAPGPSPGRTREGEVLVLGGTGFIGRHLVAALARAGHPVRLLARRAVPPAVDGAAHQPAAVRGDIRDPDAVARAVQGCRAVIHLVSGAPAGWAEYERLFVEGTRNAAEACLRHGTPQLLFVSSIAAYYLGRRGATVTEDTPLDDSPRRAEYTRAKVSCERLLMELHRTRGLPVTIFRPGVVVGAGGPVEHLGSGYWPAPTHCVSWGRRTRSPLPFVLAGDVAAALVGAVGRPGLEGRSFNLVGDVRLSAEEYVAAVSEESGRDVRLHRQSILKWYAIDLAKWAVKAVARKPENAFPSYRDLASRALLSPFECARAKDLLGWAPVADRERFIELGIRQALGGGEP
jgi:predicted dehydrogenase/nucleoside-diphosphate-sugar epimerase